MNQPPSAEPSTVFERELIDLVAAAFGRGTDVEGVWEIAFPVSHAPSWTVTIEKHEPDVESSYDPEFLEG